MVALRISFTPPIEPHYAEQLLTTALETAHGASLAGAMIITACERLDDATVATLDVRDDAATDVRGALVLAGGPAKASLVVEATAPSVGALPPRAAPQTQQLRPFAGYGAGLW
mgnify:CR=1 FL=1